jgi:hypothetical protein
MHTIRLREFQNYERELIYEYLVLQNETEYRILYPKSTVDPTTERYMIFWEYHLVAYMGHKLSEISESFAYYVPAPNAKHPYLFDIVVNDPGKLADTLYYLISVFYEKDHQAMFDFEEEAADHSSDAYHEKIQAACFGLIYIASQYLDGSEPPEPKKE